MATTPPEQPTTTAPPTTPRQYGYMPGNTDFARLPIPGNAEFAVFAVVVLLFAIITLVSDKVDAPIFVTATAAVTFAYLISRGIAKASRVLEQ